MRTSLILSVLLGAGAIAHPHYKLNDPLAHHHNKRDDRIIAVEYFENAQGQTTEVVDVVEAVSTVYAGGASPPSPAATTTAAAVNVKADYHAPAPAPAAAPKAVAAPAPAAAPKAAVAPAPAPVKEQPASPPSSGGSGATVGGQNVLDVANKWRSKQGLGTFTWDDALATVSANTNAANGANSMTHHMVPPSLGQVITEGSSTLAAPSSEGELGTVDLMWLGLVW